MNKLCNLKLQKQVFSEYSFFLNSVYLKSYSKRSTKNLTVWEQLSCDTDVMSDSATVNLYHSFTYIFAMNTS